jgi:hypothetical protein
MTLPLVPLEFHALMIQIVDQRCVRPLVTGVDLFSPSRILAKVSEIRHLERQAWQLTMNLADVASNGFGAGSHLLVCYCLRMDMSCYGGNC